MAITQALCNSYKKEILEGVHTSTHVYKIALYTSSASLDANTTAYTTNNEVSSTAGTNYSAGGTTLSGFATASSSNTAFIDFSDPSWAASYITARGAMIYNSSVSNKAVAVYDFGSDVISTNGTFTVVMPSATSTAAVIRIT